MEKSQSPFRHKSGHFYRIPWYDRFEKTKDSWTYLSIGLLTIAPSFSTFSSISDVNGRPKRLRSTCHRVRIATRTLEFFSGRVVYKIWITYQLRVEKKILTPYSVLSCKQNRRISSGCDLPKYRSNSAKAHNSFVISVPIAQFQLWDHIVNTRYRKFCKKLILVWLIFVYELTRQMFFENKRRIRRTHCIRLLAFFVSFEIVIKIINFVFLHSIRKHSLERGEGRDKKI